jgi:hypothetical protein
MNKKLTKKPTGKKFAVIYQEHGEDCLGGHRDEWKKLDGVYDTREEAIAALKKDMDAYKNQWPEDVDNFVVEGWRVIVSEDFIDASCEWDVVEISRG